MQACPWQTFGSTVMCRCQSMVFPSSDSTTALLFREFLSGPAISRGPVWTMRTNFAFGIIRALLMRTADDARAHDDGLGPVFLNEGEDLICRGVIVPKIGGFRGPCAKLSDRIFVVDNNFHGYLRSAGGIGSVERHRGQGVSAQATFSLFLEFARCPLDLSHISAPLPARPGVGSARSPAGSSCDRCGGGIRRGTF